MNVTHTTIEDIHAIEPGHRFDMEWRTYFDQVGDQKALDAYLATYCRTIWHEDEIMGIGGVTPLWDHVGEVWICLSEPAFDHAPVIARHIKDLIHVARSLLEAHRIQVTLAPKNHDFGKFLEKLGFEYEGTLRSYLRANEDYHLYARIWT